MYRYIIEASHWLKMTFSTLIGSKSNNPWEQHTHARTHTHTQQNTVVLSMISGPYLLVSAKFDLISEPYITFQKVLTGLKDYRNEFFFLLYAWFIVMLRIQSKFTFILTPFFQLKSPKYWLPHVFMDNLCTVEPQWLEHLLGPWKFVRGMGSSSPWGLIMASVQEANSDNLGKSFLHSVCMLSVLIRIASTRRF